MLQDLANYDRLYYENYKNFRDNGKTHVEAIRLLQLEYCDQDAYFRKTYEKLSTFWSRNDCYSQEIKI